MNQKNMGCYVLKFGGTSVANIARIEHAASKVEKQVLSGHNVVVVVSAMAGMTNQLIDYTKDLNASPLSPEYDVVASAGEQITVGLMTLALKKRGLKAQPFLAWQVPIQTTSDHSQANILKIPCEKIEKSLNQGVVPVIAGFQGVSAEGYITTLGRGGSDATAVAVAAALKADRCDIYTDVEGVYTADPRIVPLAKKLKVISYPEMIELAAQGAKVLQARSVELGMRHKINLQVLSSFVDSPGTIIVNERSNMEGTVVSGIAHNLNEARIIIRGVPDDIGIAAKIFGSLAKERISADMIMQNYPQDGLTNVTFTISKSDIDRTLVVLEELKSDIGFSQVAVDCDIVKISVIGVGIRSDLNIATLVFKTLADHNINIQLISTSEIKLSVVIAHDQITKAMCALHTAFCLDEVMDEKDESKTIFT